eukprot:3180839-Amphidinium_carterae.1
METVDTMPGSGDQYCSLQCNMCMHSMSQAYVLEGRVKDLSLHRYAGHAQGKTAKQQPHSQVFTYSTKAFQPTFMINPQLYVVWGAHRVTVDVSHALDLAHATLLLFSNARSIILQ